jgi:subtilisin family serine protease
MATKKSSSKSRAKPAAPGTEGSGGRPADPGATPSPEPQGELTGRYIVTFKEGAKNEAVAMMSRSAGIGAMASAADWDDGAVNLEEAGSGDLYFDQLDVCVMSAPPDQLNALSLAASEEEDSAILAIEPERYMYTAAVDPSVAPAGDIVPEAEPGDTVSFSRSYLRGYRDAVVHLYEQLAGGDSAAALAAAADAFADNEQATWGLAATRVLNSRFSGRGVRVAVLDTGMDLQHPDFAGRAITSQSFITGEAVQDGHGHGTHCVGTSCGPQRPLEGRRYGVAFNAQIFAGKVLSNGGRGPDGGILAGINWALTNRCQVISMSLSALAAPSMAYEQVAQRALTAGTLIVAAASNDSKRSQGLFQPVGRPANSPSVLAVAALDSKMKIADFSNRGSVTGGGQVDIAGPGVAVHSCWPMPTRFRSISGTSMATPHVAGIAALWIEARQVTGAALWQVLTSNARRLGLPSVDVGAGLVQAP